MQFPLAAWTLWPSAHSSHAGHLAALAEWNVVGLDLLDRNPLLPHTTLPVKWEEWRKGQWQNHTMSVGELLFDKNAQISLISRLKIHNDVRTSIMIHNVSCGCTDLQESMCIPHTYCVLYASGRQYESFTCFLKTPLVLTCLYIPTPLL